MDGALKMIKTEYLLKRYEQKIVSPGGEVYLNKNDSMNFIGLCEEYEIPIYGIDIVKVTKTSTESPLDKTIVYRDQKEVYISALAFIKDQMNYEWNYAIIVTG